MDTPTVVEDTQVPVINTVNFILNGISILACLLVLITFLYIRLTRPQLVDRTSLRLSVAISLSDLGFSAFQIYSNAIGNNPGCSFSVWGYILFANLAGALYACIAFNLQIVFVMQRKYAVHEYWYYMLALALALLTSMAGVAGSQYGWNEAQETCWYVGEGTLSSLLWQWATLYLWASLTTVYCGVVILVVVWRLTKESRLLDQTIRDYRHKDTQSEHITLQVFTTVGRQQETDHVNEEGTAAVRATIKRRRKRQRQILHLVRRLVLYPVIPILTQTWNIIVAMLIYINQDAPYWLVFVSFEATAIQGLLNAIAFFLDPAIVHALQVKRNSVDTDRQEQLQHYGHASLTTTLCALVCCVYKREKQHSQVEQKWWKADPSMSPPMPMTSIHSMYESAIQTPWTSELESEPALRVEFTEDVRIRQEVTQITMHPMAPPSLNSSSDGGDEVFRVL